MRRIKFTNTEKLILVVLACLFSGYWWVIGYVWFRIDNHNVSINGRSLAEAEGSDYFCFKSLSENIFCYHQDHGTQYLISPVNKEVSIISQEVNVDYLEVILIAGGARDGFKDSSFKKKLSDTPIVVGNGFVEFTPSITEWKSPEVQRWRISF